MAAKRLKARVVGRVQGVFFRASTEDQAQALGLSGWVRNTEDGAVEVLAEGDEESLQRLLGWLQRGPSGARVDSVEHHWSNGTRRYGSFQVVYRPPAED